MRCAIDVQDRASFGARAVLMLPQPTALRADTLGTRGHSVTQSLLKCLCICSRRTPSPIQAHGVQLLWARWGVRHDDDRLPRPPSCAVRSLRSER